MDTEQARHYDDDDVVSMRRLIRPYTRLVMHTPILQITNLDSDQANRLQNRYLH